MKKTISTILIVVILFNFICCNKPVYAVGSDDSGNSDETKLSDIYVNESAEGTETISVDILEDGNSNNGSGTKKATTTSSLGSSIGTIIGILALAIDILVVNVELLMSQLTYCTENSGAATEDLQYFFSIDRAVFNRIPLFNVNYFNTEDTYQVGDITLDASQGINDIKESVAFTFYICKLIAIAIALLVLIYIGIRMALSTVASEEAKYKKMLTGWFESIVLLFTLQYIMVAIIWFGELLTNLFFKVRCTIMATGRIPFEQQIKENLYSSLFERSGLQLSLYSLMYWFLLFTQLKFFWTYIKRVLMTGFLIMISPIITVTYAIDKAGDGKAQAFSIWFKEFTVNILIQPLHAVIYLVFMFTANEIAQKAPILALAFLLSMGTVEKMVKVIFNMEKLVTLKGINKFLKKG